MAMVTTAMGSSSELKEIKHNLLIFTIQLKNSARPKIHVGELTWWKPREARLLISKLCYGVWKHLCAARPALPSWVLPNARSRSLCTGPPPPRSATSGTAQGFQATNVLRFSSSATQEPPSLGMCSDISPHLLQAQEAHVLCKPWGNITRIA